MLSWGLRVDRFTSVQLERQRQAPHASTAFSHRERLGSWLAAASGKHMLEARERLLPVELCNHAKPLSQCKGNGLACIDSKRRWVRSSQWRGKGQACWAGLLACVGRRKQAARERLPAQSPRRCAITHQALSLACVERKRRWLSSAR